MFGGNRDKENFVQEQLQLPMPVTQIPMDQFPEESNKQNKFTNNGYVDDDDIIKSTIVDNNILE